MSVTNPSALDTTQTQLPDLINQSQGRMHFTAASTAQIASTSTFPTVRACRAGIMDTEFNEVQDRKGLFVVWPLPDPKYSIDAYATPQIVAFPEMVAAVLQSGTIECAEVLELINRALGTPLKKELLLHLLQLASENAKQITASIDDIMTVERKVSIVEPWWLRFDPITAHKASVVNRLTEEARRRLPQISNGVHFVLERSVLSHTGVVGLPLGISADSNEKYYFEQDVPVKLGGMEGNSVSYTAKVALKERGVLLMLPTTERHQINPVATVTSVAKAIFLASRTLRGLEEVGAFAQFLAA